MVITGRLCAAPDGLDVGQPHHRAVVVDQLADRADRGEPGQAAQVDRGLGVPRPLEDPAGAGAQRDDVPRTDEAVGGRLESASSRMVVARSAALMPW